ncbi:MAG: hypothetical protein PVG03_19250 [Desulfarculaceae bacterium]|jgi:hypothetical protein
MNKPLIFGGVMSTLAALLHIAIIFGGADWYRYFGAGEEMARMAEQGSWIPTILTLGIFLILQIWGIYAFSGAGLIRRLPLLKPALVVISAIYLIRGLLLIPVWIIDPDFITFLHIWSSIASVIIGGAYANGTKRVSHVRTKLPSG